MIEHSGFSRLKEVAHIEIRATRFHTAEEVRFLLGPHPGLEPAADLRALGCPQLIFERMLEKRKNKIAQLELRAKSRQQAEIIAKDK
jgi:hypothetical protein